MIIWSKSGNTVIYIIESNPINLIYLHVIICLKSLLSLEASISRSLKKACRIYKRKKSWNHQPNIQFCIHPPQLHLPFHTSIVAGVDKPSQHTSWIFTPWAISKAPFSRSSWEWKIGSISWNFMEWRVGFIEIWSRKTEDVWFCFITNTNWISIGLNKRKWD